MTQGFQRALLRPCLVAALAALSACTAEPSLGGALAFEPCRLEPLGTAARCTTLRVPENRGTLHGREIELRVAILPALARSPRMDPLFLLVGGPGQAATEAGAQIAEVLQDVRRLRDIVLVDQRGTGGSHPLDCDRDEEEPLAERFAPAADLERTRECLSELDADTTAYATPQAMADLEEVRERLGHAQINLWGGSYGTRAALVYYREHPARVRSLVLDGAAPPWIELQLLVARTAQRALDLTLSACAADDDCHQAFPDTRARLERLLSDLAVNARISRVAHPRTHVPTELRIERAGLAMAVLQALYAPDLARLLPLAVDRAHQGDFGALVAMGSAFSDSVDMASGMFLSVVCAEDIKRVTPQESAEMTAGTFLGSEWLDRLRAACDEWPSAVLPESYFAPVRGDVPALILSGQLDPVTPPAWGEQVALNLPRSRHVVVEGAAHGVTVTGCVPKLISEFLEAGSPAALDLGCLERSVRPAFFISLGGPKP